MIWNRNKYVQCILFLIYFYVSNMYLLGSYVRVVHNIYNKLSVFIQNRLKCRKKKHNIEEKEKKRYPLQKYAGKTNFSKVKKKILNGILGIVRFEFIDLGMEMDSWICVLHISASIRKCVNVRICASWMISVGILYIYMYIKGKII